MVRQMNSYQVAVNLTMKRLPVNQCFTCGYQDSTYQYAHLELAGALISSREVVYCFAKHLQLHVLWLLDNKAAEAGCKVPDSFSVDFQG